MIRHSGTTSREHPPLCSPARAGLVLLVVAVVGLVIIGVNLVMTFTNVGPAARVDVSEG